MATIDTHLMELAAAEAVYAAMVDGFTAALNLPGLSPEESAELSEDLSAAQERLVKLQASLAADRSLKDDGYPDGLGLTAQQAVLDALNARIKKIQDAVNGVTPEVLLADAATVSVS